MGMKTAVFCEYGGVMKLYDAEKQVKELVPGAAYYGYKKGHTVILSPCSYKKVDDIPSGHRYYHAKVGESIYSAIYSNIDPQGACEVQLSLFDM